MLNQEHNVVWPGWEVVRRIGSGSFGTVYEIQRDVYGDIERAALKVITLPRSEDEIDYLRSTGLDDASITQAFHQQVGDIAREYKLMVQMRTNPNIVRCDDFRDIQRDNGLGWDIYIKMELLNPLMKNLDKVANEKAVIQLGKDMCNALIACQEKNIIHRDIKPQNVFVSDDGVFKLGDFGIARTIERATIATAGIGTYSYMAPEVERNQPYGKSADIYSLGLMMYWLLNERRGPFMPLPPVIPKHADEEQARMRRFSGEPIPAPKNGSPRLKAIVLKACAFDPKARYQTAQEMMDALIQLGQPGAGTPIIPNRANTNFANTIVVPGHQPNSNDDDKTQGVIPIIPNTGKPQGYTSPVTSNTVKPQGYTPVNHNTVKPQGYTPPITPPPVTPPVYTPVTPPPVTPPVYTPVAPNTTGAQSYTPVDHTAPQKEESRSKAPLFIILGIVTAVILIVGLILGLSSCDGSNSSSNTNATNPPIVQPTTPTAEPTVEATVPFSPEQQIDWSGWIDTLPATVTADGFDIEERVVYSSRTQETTSSTNKTMAGWELYDTVEGGSGYGPWSSWFQTKVTASDTREVQTQIQYRYRNKETTTSTSPSKSGWTQYGSPTTSWGSWSSWSTTKPASGANINTESKTQYRYRNTSSTNGSWSSWSAWQDTPVTKSDTVDVKTRTVYTFFYYQCTNCSLRWYTYGSPCTGCGTTNSRYVPVSLSSESLLMDIMPFMSSGYYYSNDGTGNVFTSSPNNGKTQYAYRTLQQGTSSTGSWSAWGDTPYTATSTREVETRTVYRYRTKTTVYSFWRWGGWTSWSTTKVTANSNREVQEVTFYRYREKSAETTYYFRRWSEWTEFSENEVEESDTVEVQTKTQYRYKVKSS